MPSQLVRPVNMSEEIYVIIRSGRASYVELQEKLSVKDMYNLLEAISVDNYNERVWHRFQESKR